MTKQFFLFVFLFTSLTSCRDDFTLEGPYQDIPVVYAFLDPGAQNNFVRVEKAFLEAGGNAAVNAGIADSIYYGPGEATVVLTDLTTLTEYELERVDGADFGLEREEGIFAQTPNVLYRLSERVLAPGRAVQLAVQRPGQPDAVAVTTMLRSVTITRPTNQARIGDYRQPLAIRWDVGANAALFDVDLLFNLQRFDLDASTSEDIQLVFDAARAIERPARETRSMIYEQSTEDIYRFIGQELTAGGRTAYRLNSMDIRVTAVGQEALDRLILQNANSGITSSQSLPRYSNVANGIGLVTSRVTRLQEGITLDDASQDSLRDGRYTADLNFQ